jgi:hypothetical protein
MNTIFDIVNRWVQENYSTVRYSVQGQPVIQTLPENYHVNAQLTQTITRSNVSANRYAIAPDNFTGLDLDGLYFVEYTIIPELPRWYGDAAARESATGEHTDAGQRATHERAAGDTGRGPDHSAFYDYVRDAIAYERGDWRFSAEL